MTSEDIKHQLIIITSLSLKLKIPIRPAILVHFSSPLTIHHSHSHTQNHIQTAWPASAANKLKIPTRAAISVHFNSPLTIHHPRNHTQNYIQTAWPASAANRHYIFFFFSFFFCLFSSSSSFFLFCLFSFCPSSRRALAPIFCAVTTSDSHYLVPRAKATSPPSAQVSKHWVLTALLPFAEPQLLCPSL